MVNFADNKKNEVVKGISNWLFFLGIMFISIGFIILIVLSFNEVEFNLFLIPNLWSLGFLILGLISFTGGAIIYTIRLLK